MKNLFFCVSLGLMALLTSCAGGNSEAGEAAATNSHNKAEMNMMLNIERRMQPGHVSEFINSFLKCKVETMKEPGCVSYDIYQSTVDTCVIFITETWKNEDAWKEHSATEHLKIHSEEVKGLGDSSYKGVFKKIFICPEANK